jgi:hypothetical protein
MWKPIFNVSCAGSCTYPPFGKTINTIMATTNNNNDFASLASILRNPISLTEATLDVSPDVGIDPIDFNRRANFKEAYTKMLEIEIKHQLDFAYPDDDYTSQLVSNFYALKHQCMGILSDIDDPQLSTEVMERCMEYVTVTASVWKEAHEKGWLRLDVLSDDDSEDDFFDFKLPTP